MRTHHSGNFRVLNVNLLLLLLLNRHWHRQAKSDVYRLLVAKLWGVDWVTPLVVDDWVCLIVMILCVSETLCKRGSSSLVFDCEGILHLPVSCAIRQSDDSSAVDVFLTALSCHILDKEAKFLADELL